MANLVIYIQYSDIISQCALLSSYEARDKYDASGQSEFEQIHIGAADHKAVTEFLTEGKSRLRLILDDMITDETSVQDSGWSWTFRTDETRYRQKGAEIIAMHVREAVTSYAMACWMRQRDYKDRAAFYDGSFANMSELVRTRLYKKESPLFPADYHPYSTLDKIRGYLYEASYDNIDYDYAQGYFEGKAPVPAGACSVLSVGGLVGRTYDWLDNYDAVICVHTPRMRGRNAVLGIAGSTAELSVQAIDNDERTEAWRLLPFKLQDGINDKGLFAAILVAPARGDGVAHPAAAKRDRICSVMLVRYILDYFDTVDDAVGYIQSYVEVFTPAYLLAMGYEAHFVLKDSGKCVVLELEDGAFVTVQSDICTNFHVSGVTPGQDGNVFTNADAGDGDLPTSQGIEEDGSGLERWNILNAARDSISGKDDMIAAMDSVRYSKTYTNGTGGDTDAVWYSELVGDGVTVDTPPTDDGLAARLAQARQEYVSRSKDNPRTWLTTHRCVYDLAAGKVYVAVQEDTVHNDTFQLHV